MLNEIWKPITGYEGLYDVSNFGRVKSLMHTIYRSNGIKQCFKERILKPGHMMSGYDFVGLTKNKQSKNHSVHRLVANAFLPNPNNYSDVNHIDGNKKNNRIDNLEWCTRGQNLKHAVEIGLVENQCKIKRPVIVKRGEKIVAFETMKDCAKFFGFKKSWLHNRIRKHGLAFDYGDYRIEVSERRGA